MRELILLYWGCIFLMYLSQTYRPYDIYSSKAEYRSFMWHRADVFILLAIAWMTFFSALRTSYNDTGVYISHFETAESISEFFAAEGFSDWTGNPFSTFYRDLIREITDNYHVYFFFPAFLSSFAIVKLFKRYSVNPAFSLMVFFSIGTYILYLAALKQCLAMFILLLALPYAIDRKYIRFYLLVFIAILFHTHAFMFALIPFLMEKPWGKMTWAGLAVVVFLMATYDVTLRAFMEYAQSIGAMVAENEVFDGHSVNVLRVLVYWVPALFALFFRGRLFSDSSRTENLFVNMSVVSAMILTIGLVEGANLYARMAGYFELASAVALPWMLQKVFTKQSTKVITMLAGALYFAYFLFEFAITKNFGDGYRAISLFKFVGELLG